MDVWVVSFSARVMMYCIELFEYVVNGIERIRMD